VIDPKTCVHAADESADPARYTPDPTAAPVASVNVAPAWQVRADTAERNHAGTVISPPARTDMPVTFVLATDTDWVVMSPPADDVSCRLFVPACACAAVWATAQFDPATHVPMLASKSVFGETRNARSAVIEGTPPSSSEQNRTGPVSGWFLYSVKNSAAGLSPQAILVGTLGKSPVSFVADWFSGKNGFGYATPGFSFSLPKNQVVNIGYSFGNYLRKNNGLFVYYGVTF
jgi:hypothetical protein